jgi:ribosome biogenesis GTPase
MSKRRITHQQSARIEKKQKRYRQPTAPENPAATLDGLIIRRFSRHAIVETITGDRTHCSIRPTIDSLVSGDRVVWQAEGENQGVVVSRYPRESVLGRPDKQGQLRPVAANITQVIIVVAPKPEISWPLLDSYLVMTEYLKLRVCILLNKADLPCEQLQKRLLQQYEALGYTILFTRKDDKSSFNRLQNILDNQISVFVGQSGVGKSSLISQILPLELNIQTAAISDHADLGKHTTSNSCLYHVPTGGALIDSPGIREFGLWHMPAVEIAKSYREFQPYLSQCRFRNCNHRDTIGCEIIAAVKNNLIARDRYENYVKISTQFAK